MTEQAHPNIGWLWRGQSKRKKRVIVFVLTVLLLGNFLNVVTAVSADASWFTDCNVSTKTVTVKNIDGKQFNIAKGNCAYDTVKFLVPAGNCLWDYYYTAGLFPGQQTYGVTKYGKTSAARWVSIPWNLVTHNPYNFKVATC